METFLITLILPNVVFISFPFIHAAMCNGQTANANNYLHQSTLTNLGHSVRKSSVSDVRFIPVSFISCIVPCIFLSLILFICDEVYCLDLSTSLVWWPHLTCRLVGGAGGRNYLAPR